MSFQRILLLVLFVASVALGRTVVNLDQQTGLLEKRTRTPLFKDPLNRAVNVDSRHPKGKFHDAVPVPGKYPKNEKNGSAEKEDLTKEKEEAIAEQQKKVDLAKEKLDEAIAKQQQSENSGNEDSAKDQKSVDSAQKKLNEEIAKLEELRGGN
ncbi:uncharacterized protein PGTG_22620 [Puccinia graminis f. sp. tritici CRL 75-36-700-3]|uniref:Uncharacterized protein n=1 Tax=Puccinia graminis f. sp. tritici (strain CRL 75-36-700-3 / race SCCL) TaxID=418459 RepID=H6QV37_PUCGT|nr:uncharacterized protein PGTG_22620 [Puccinia graminis f. sp. tritici CRL 75-36-700-3]EHS62698.1 hypothetical protein PGTG_22620 [Puccinia graminis f. sp. tritici CRL 75-36-700-3]